MNETYYVYCAGCTNVKGSFIPKQIHEPPYCGNCGKEVKMNETQKTAKTTQNNQVEDKLFSRSDFEGDIVPIPSGLLSIHKDATNPRDKNKTIQEVGTDPLLFEVLNRRFNFAFDLACNKENCLTKSMGFPISQKVGFCHPEYDALKESWFPINGFDYISEKWLWLNPPFKEIKPWAMKCAEEARKGAKIVMLTPASVGSKWFADYVYPNAYVRILTGRLTFKGHKTSYPKDTMISIFDNFHKGFDLWDWKAEN